MSPSGSCGDRGRPVWGSIVGDVDGFLAIAWGERPWRSVLDGHADLFGVDDVDTIVSSAARAPAIRMVLEGERVPSERFCTPTRIGSTTLCDVADPRKVLDLLRAGATLVLQSLHRTWPPLSRWCAELEGEIGWPVQANAYLTPPGRRGLARHADGHDVIAVQLHGTKTWDVDGLAARVVVPGEVLYLPAACGHEAWTTDEPSLHLTVGVHRPGAARLAASAARAALADEPSPAHGGATTPDEVLGHLRRGLDGIDAPSIEERLRRPPRRHTGGLIAASVRRPQLQGGTLVRRVERVWEVGGGKDDVALTTPSITLRLPSGARAAIEHISAAAPEQAVRVRDVPGLTESDALVLVTRLLDEGVLVLDGTETTGAIGVAPPAWS